VYRSRFTICAALLSQIAESIDISAYALKRLVNHKMTNDDVTAGYIISDGERLRKPMQQIFSQCDSIFQNQR
jgi:hypothetical protein